MASEIRHARPGEGIRLSEIHLASGRAAWAGHLPPAGLAVVTSHPEQWEGWISDPEFVCLVAEHRGEAAALAVLCPSSDPDTDPQTVALLDRLCTEPRAWRRGLGRAVLTASMAELRERGYREAILWTAQWNRSRGFFEENGWAVDGATGERTFAGATFTEVRYRTSVPG